MATMNEELQIKITADTSELDTGISRATTKLKNFGKEGGTSLGMSADAADQLHNSLAGIRQMSFTGMIASLTNLGTTLAADYKQFQYLKSMAGIATSTLKEFVEQNRGIIDNGRNFGDMSDEVAGVWKEYDKLTATSKEANAEFKNLNNSYTALKGTNWAFVAGIIAATAAVAALVAQIRMAIRTAQAVKQINADAAKIGMSVQAYQQWGYVLESVGVEAQELSSFIKTLSDEQAQIAEGSEGASKAFEKLGLSIGEVTSMNQEQLFTETVERLQGVENAVERTKLAYQIFGEDAAHLANVMNMSNEQMRTLINNYNLLGGGASQALVEKSNTLSLSLQNLRQAWTGLTNALSELFMPVITAVVNWLTKAIAIVRMFIQTVFGLDTTPASNAGSNMATGMSSYAAATNSATKAVQKLKREQMGFDELNKLPGKDSSGSSGAGAGDLGLGGGGVSGGGFTLPEAADLGLDKWQSWFNKYKNLIQDISTWSLIGVGVLMMVAGAMGGFNIPMILGGAALAGIGIAIGSTEGGTFDRLSEKIKTICKDLKDWFKTNIAPVFTKEYWVKKWDTIRTTAQEKLEAVKAVVSEKWNGVKDWWNKNAAKYFTKTYWFEKFENIRYSASYKLEQAKTAISEKWNAVKDWFSKNIAPKFTKTYWFNKFEQIRYSLAYKLDQAKQVVVDKWKGVKDWFSKNIAPKFTKTYWFNKFDTIKSGAKSAFNGVIDVVERAVNGIIKKINTLSWSIPNWVPVYGGKKFGFNFKQISIPRLATGGIATRSTLANIGENGAEAVLPLEQNTGWMDTLADKIAARQGGASKIVLMVDGKELGWASINGINSITKQTGNLQLQLV